MRRSRAGKRANEKEKKGEGEGLKDLLERPLIIASILYSSTQSSSSLFLSSSSAPALPSKARVRKKERKERREKKKQEHLPGLLLLITSGSGEKIRVLHTLPDDAKDVRSSHRTIRHICYTRARLSHAHIHTHTHRQPTLLEKRQI